MIGAYMFKKTMMCAVMMSASIPVCAGRNITITSLGDAYKITVKRQYVRLNSDGRAARDANGNCDWERPCTESRLEPNMSMQVQRKYPDQVYVTITHKKTTVLDNVESYGGNIVLDKNICWVDGQQVDADGNAVN